MYIDVEFKSVVFFMSMIERIVQKLYMNFFTVWYYRV